MKALSVLVFGLAITYAVGMTNPATLSAGPNTDTYGTNTYGSSSYGF